MKNASGKSMKKIFSFTSFRNRLLFTFLGFTNVTIIVAGISMWFYGRINTMTEITSQLETCLTQILRLIKTEEDFFNQDVLNPEFYTDTENKYLPKHHKLSNELKKQLYALLELEGMKRISTKKNEIGNDIKNIIQELDSYEKAFTKLVQYTRQKGFKDKGVEGRMRLNMGKLEESLLSNKNYIENKYLIVLLNKYENTFIIERDTSYVQKFNNVLGKIDKNIMSASEIIYLDNYVTNFREFVQLETVIGLDNTRGIKRQIRIYGDNTAKYMETLVRDMNQDVLDGERSLFSLFVVLITVMILISISLSYWIASRMTQPIIHLSEVIHSAIQKKFLENVPITLKIKNNDEIGNLTQDFSIMLKEIQTQLQEIKHQSHQLQDQNKTLNQINQQLQQLNSVKDTFFSIISHDVRSPLNSFSGYLSVLEIEAQAFTPEETKKFVQDTQKSISRVLELLDNLLQWSLSQTDGIEYKPVVLQLNEIVKENIALYTKTAQQKNIEIYTQIPEHTFVKADKNMLDFVLRNLVNNAIKFSNEGSRIDVLAHYSDKKQDQDQKMVISIKDFGVGMTKEHLEKVFKPEEHITTLGTNAERGTGFGLLLCKNFVERNNGTIRIESHEGKGTLIEFTLEKVEN